ncbi:MAG TPA: hypothetical protein VL547_00600 [Dinghuibacter sp.]|uniref:hypothetical protein n=1 Tax=Dinghuibacter sp. TaxID=2024697 RepID=UPI002C0452FE|nr:hypothetical protein [Dinghuibacter sp.]HTJ10487.1 hypothetical protein [Dinghuibacter sp.]
MPNPEMFEWTLNRTDTSENVNADIPSSVILVRPHPGDPAGDLLLLDQVPLPRNAWQYDTHDKVLRWRGAFGGGDLHLGHDGLGASGVIGGDSLRFVGVQARATVRFLCDVALDCGVAYVTGRGGTILSMDWDPSSPQWKNANWIKDRLRLIYSVDKSNPLAPPDFTFVFEDLETKALPWEPFPDEFGAMLDAGDYKGRLVWDLGFQANVPPPRDENKPSTGPDSVYPYWLLAREQAAMVEINGAIQIDDFAPAGRLAGFRGLREHAMIAGYYQTDAGHAAFGLFGGDICLDGQARHRCRAIQNGLSWTGLPETLQQRLGLPAAGVLAFDPSGDTGTFINDGTTIRRLTAAEALQAVAAHQDLYGQVYSEARTFQARLDDVSPDMYGLLAMSQFRQNKEGAWIDEVQKGVMDDMSAIMNSFVSKDLWKRLFPGTPQPVLKGRLAEVAASPVPGVKDPAAWYQSLSTVVLTNGLADGSNPNCKHMNGPRAAAWLHEEVANSKVYATHSQLLFRYRWEDLNATIVLYWEDQARNAEAHTGAINDQVAVSLLEIDGIVTDKKTPPDLIGQLKADVVSSGVYAMTNKLYWAFAYYAYNIHPMVLAQIGQGIGSGSGSKDGTALARMLQQNIAVLTALDPSGFFARQYNAAINNFLATNILPSMYGFTGEAEDYSLVKEYLQKFVEQNIDNSDVEIARAAGEMQAIVDAENFDELLQESLASLRSISGFTRTAMALPVIAGQWEQWFKQKHPRFSNGAAKFGSLLIGGLGLMNMINLIKTYQSWDQMDKGKRAQVILDTVQMGLQVFAAVVKRGVRIGAIFNVTGMNVWQRSVAISSILIDGTTEQLNTGLMGVSNKTALWLGDTAGAAALREEVALLMNITENQAVEIAWTARVFGSNLNEFIATRMGPLLMLGGIALSIYFIVEGRSGVALGSEIINIISGSLTLFAMAGGWLIQGGFIAAGSTVATVISAAGPLAIVAAVVGIALMIYLMFQKPPDPVEEFVNDYVKPAGFFVPSKCCAIDYVIPYKLSSQNDLLMLGFSLETDGKLWTARPDGAIDLTTGSSLPDCVWKVDTTGFGLSRIAALVQTKPGASPVGLMLSLMSDHTISFQPKMGTGKKDKQPVVLTQTWETSCLDLFTRLANDGTALASLAIRFQPVFADGEGKYRSGQGIGWIDRKGDKLVYSTEGTGSLFTLKMAGIAPNFVTMPDLSFMLDSIPYTGQAYGPNYGLTPSSPITFTPPANLPDFLKFDKETGTIAPNGNKAREKMNVPCVLEMKNSLGGGKVTFRVIVEPAPVKEPVVL